jgi:hypothetical protein
MLRVMFGFGLQLVFRVRFRDRASSSTMDLFRVWFLVRAGARSRGRSMATVGLELGLELALQ